MSDATSEPAADADASTIRTHFESVLGAKDGLIAAKDVEILVLRSIPGLDTSKPNVQAFLGSYKGEMTPEKVAEAAKEWNIEAPAAAAPVTTDGAVPPPTTPAAAPVTDAEKAALAATAAAVGASAPGAEGDDPHPTAKGLADFETEMKSGAERETAAGAFIDSVFGAAAKGDERVILEGGRQGVDTRR